MGRWLQESVTVGQESAAGCGALWAWRPWLTVNRRGNRRRALGLRGLALRVGPQAANQARSQTSAWTGVVGTTELADRGNRNTVGVFGSERHRRFPSYVGDGCLSEQ